METRFVPAPPDGADQERSSGLLHVLVKAPRRARSSGGRSRRPPSSWPSPATRLLHDDAARAGLVVRRVLAGARAGRPRSTRPSCSPTAPGSASTRPRPDRRPAEPIVPPTSRRRAADIEPGTPLGAHFGARSGDKGGNANVGIWARDDAGYAWLAAQPDRRRGPPPDPGGRRPRRRRPRAAQPAGAQHRARRLPRRGRRQLDGVRPPGQGPRRVPPIPRPGAAGSPRSSQRNVEPIRPDMSPRPRRPSRVR